jgi:alpha-mannosidase
MGTLSVRASDKQRYAAATRRLERIAEPLAALTGIDVGTRLEEAWTLILQNAAHDTACGSGIDAVADVARRRSEIVARIATNITDRCLPALAGDGQVWNPSPFPRQAVVEVDGRPMLSPMVRGFSAATMQPVSPRASVGIRSMRLENTRLEVTLQRDGTFDVVDRQTATHFRGLNRLIDEADAGDEYNFSPVDDSRLPPEAVRNFRTSVLEEHAVRGRLQAEFDYVVFGGLSPDRRRRGSTETTLPVRLVLSLDADSPRLDVDLQLVNTATDHRLRVHQPLPFPVRESAADTAFHVTRRPVIAARRDPGAPEVELPTYPLRSFVDVSDGHAGLAVITDGLHEYEVLPGPPQVLAITLLRAVGWLSRDDLTTRTGHAGPAVPTPGAQVSGGHRMRYSLYFHAGNWEQGGVWRAAEAALHPLLPGRGPRVDTTPAVIELEPDCIQLTACVPRPDGYDLRILNASDASHDASVTLQPKAGQVESITLAGEVRQHLPVHSDHVTVSMRPWEIVTLRLRR